MENGLLLDEKHAVDVRASVLLITTSLEFILREFQDDESFLDIKELIGQMMGDLYLEIFRKHVLPESTSFDIIHLTMEDSKRIRAIVENAIKDVASSI